MHTLQFLEASRDRTLALAGSYDAVLVAVSVLMASLAYYAAFGLAERIVAAETQRAKRLWLFAGAAAMGVGIWAMHFIGMLAFRLPIPVAYDVGITLASVAPAVVASYVVLFVTGRAVIQRLQLVLCGTLMGLGIGTMHYTGMAAMRLEAEMYYDPVLFVGSIVVAVVLATVALYAHFRAGRGDAGDDPRRHAAAALIMGVAVAGMHYTAMGAAYFFPAAHPTAVGTVLEPTLLAILVSLAAAIILSMSIFVVVVDARLKAAAISVRTSRAHMIQAIESVSEGFCLYDSEDRLVLCNSRYRELLQLGESEDVLGKRFDEIMRGAVERGLVPEAEGRIDEWVAEVVAEHRQPSGPRIFYQPKKGLWIQINEQRTEDGGTVAIGTDITALKTAEIELSEALESLKATQSQLIQTEKMAALGQLTAGIAHELNTPIGVVNSSADNFERCVTRILKAIESSQSLEEVRSDKGFQSSVQIIRDNSHVISEASERIAKIVRGLKAFSGEDSSEESADLQDCVENTLALIAHRVHDGIRISRELAQGLIVACSPATVNQVLMTLLTNAVQAIQGSGRITVETGKQQDRAHVRISDTGMGIPEDKLKSLFEFGFTTKGTRVGVGIGLANAYSAVQRHGGELTVSSAVGQGSVFTVTLPVSRTGSDS